jgi:hypothetical protein
LTIKKKKIKEQLQQLIKIGGLKKGLSYACSAYEVSSKELREQEL